MSAPNAVLRLVERWRGISRILGGDCVTQFTQCADELERAIREDQGSVWRGMDSAPMDGTHVLCCVAGVARSVGEAFWWSGAWRTWDGENHTRTHYSPDPTHWQPLPPPPETSE